jgi:hypothetical protein
MRTQQGSLFQSHGAWYVRYREYGNENPVAHKLASLAEYPKKSEVIPLTGCGKTTVRLKMLSRFRDFCN